MNLVIRFKVSFYGLIVRKKDYCFLYFSVEGGMIDLQTIQFVANAVQVQCFCLSDDWDF